MKDKLITNNTFPYFIGFTALLIALCAAFFSVYGIGSLFAGAAFSAMVMAGSLELGKLVATTFLYRYWNRAVGIIKVYLTIAVIALMVITSAGIFGFLSSAYQKSSLDFKLSQERIVSTESSKGYYTSLVKTSEDRIRILNETRKIQESRLSEALTNTFLVRNPIQLQQIQQQTIKLIDQANLDIKSENDKIDSARSQVQSIDEKINQMKIGATDKKDIQTFKFLADALHTDLDTVAKWFIISLIFVFDPLAIALILAYNVVLFKNEEEASTEKKTKLEVLPIASPIVNEQKDEGFEKKNIVKEETVVENVHDDVKNSEEVIIEEPNIIVEPEKSDVVTEEIVKSDEILNNSETPVSNETDETSNNKDVIIPPVQVVNSEMNDYYKRMFKF